MKRLTFLGFVLALAAIGLGIGFGLRRMRAPRFANAPIILISIDTLRADAVGGFGAPVQQTPNLYIVGNEGIRFPNAISAAHITAPSHATMLTGISPFVHGLTMAKQGMAYSLPSQIPTLAEILQKAGYQTAAFTDGIQLLPELGFARGFETYEANPTGLREKAPRIAEFLADVKNQPFFLFLHTYRTHQPYRPPLDLLPSLLEDYAGVYANGARAAAWLTQEQVMRRSPQQNKIGRELSGTRAADDTDRAFFRRLYDAGTTGADREIGDILGMLRKSGIYDDAIVAITSDHGEAFFEHSVDSHNTTYDECIRVPMILRLPGMAGAGRTIDATFPSVNLEPTLLDLVGVALPGPVEGISVRPWLLRGEPAEEPAFAAWYDGADTRFPNGCAVRTRDSKLIAFEDAHVSQSLQARELGPFSFFDLTSDPGETKDLAEELRPRDRDLRRARDDARSLWKSLRSHYRVEPEAASQLGEEAIEALRAVGYAK